MNCCASDSFMGEAGPLCEGCPQSIRPRSTKTRGVCACTIDVPLELSCVRESLAVTSSPLLARPVVKILFPTRHGAAQTGVLGRFLEWVVQRALLLGTNLHTQLLGQRDVTLGTVQGTREEAGTHRWEGQG